MTKSETTARESSPLPNKGALIETHLLTKYYGKSRGIIEVDLSIPSGDIFGFIGPNGAGKSTFMRTLLGMISASSGSATIFGKDIVKRKTEILSNVGYMPSEAQFYPGMKVKDVLTLSAHLRKRDCTKRAEVLCDRLNLDHSKRVEELSLGNRKKVSIVCALQHDPDLYILDEPTSGLDPLIQREFFALLMECNQKGSTIMLSSHVLSDVQRYCKHAAIIREGKIITSGTVDELSSTTARRVRIQGVDKMIPLEGVRDVSQQGNELGFLYQGNMQVLIKALSTVPLEDVTIEEPDIEEVFLHFYEQGEAS